MRKFAFTVPMAMSAALLVAACSPQAETPPTVESPVESPEQEAADETSTGPITPPPSPDPELSANEAAPAGTIPASFHGVWDYIDGTCAPESDLRLEISDGEVMFYESIGIVTGVEIAADHTVVSLNMEGEGETWKEQYRLAFAEDGKTLQPQFVGGDIVYDPMPRKRCEG